MTPARKTDRWLVKVVCGFEKVALVELPGMITGREAFYVLRHPFGIHAALHVIERPLWRPKEPKAPSRARVARPAARAFRACPRPRARATTKLKTQASEILSARQLWRFVMTTFDPTRAGRSSYSANRPAV